MREKIEVLSMKVPRRRALPVARKRPKKTLLRVRLDRRAVVEAAAALADELRSIDRVQLVDLADRLRIRTPSLYAHVDSLDDLCRSVAFVGLGELRERLNGSAAGHRGADALLAVACSIRTYALERPGVYTAAALEPRDPEWNEMLQNIKAAFVTILERFGISGEEATDCVRAIRSCVHGFVTLEAQGDFGQPDPEASFQRLIRSLLRGLLLDAQRVE